MGVEWPWSPRGCVVGTFWSTEAVAAATRRSNRLTIRDSPLCPPRRHPIVLRDAGIPGPISRVFRQGAAGVAISSHDVSMTGWRTPGPCDTADHHHDADLTMRTFSQGPASQRLEAITVVGGWLRTNGRRHSEQFPAALKLAGAVTVAEEAIISDAVKSVRQHMDQEAADKLLAVEGHRLLAVAVPVILPPKRNLAVVHRQQPVVGDGDSVGVAADIVENLRRSGEGPLREDHPFGFPKWCQVAPERRGFLEVVVRGEEVQRAGGERLRQVTQEQASEHRRQHRDRQKESWPAGDPAFTVGSDPAGGDKEVNVRTVLEILPPGVQHAEETNLARCLGSAAIFRSVSEAAWNRMS
jgi:hypothetical protein